MIEPLIEIAQWLGLWLAITLLLSQLSAVLYPLFRRLIGRCSPAVRSAATVALALLAPLAAALAVLLIIQPQWAAFLAPTHCHDTICGAHQPATGVPSLGAAVLSAGSALLLLTAIGGIVFSLRAGRRRLRTLMAFSRRKRAAPYRTLESTDVMAWCFGLWRPRVFVTTALVQRLTPAQLDAVIAHEQAHAERLDNLRSALAQLATVIWPSGRRARLRANLSADNEQACDAIARRRRGTASTLRGALLAVSTECGPLSPDRSAAFGQSGAAERIAALEEKNTVHAAALRAWLLLAALWCLQVTLATDLGHHGFEWANSAPPVRQEAAFVREP